MALLAVAALRALVLARDHEAGRDVRDAHGGVDLLHVLAALAAGTVHVDAKVLWLDST